MSNQPMTNYQKVKEFNDAFNTERVPSITPSTFDTHPGMVKLCLALIKEEVDELEDAVNGKDMVEVRDALSDILYVVYGMQYRLGIKGDEDFDIVHSSNMSKLCSTEEEAIKTVEWYNDQFEMGKLQYDTPYYEKLDHLVNGQEKWVVKNRSTGKVLKSINYTPVKWPQTN